MADTGGARVTDVGPPNGARRGEEPEAEA
jgi:hypothetical protein